MLRLGLGLGFCPLERAKVREGAGDKEVECSDLSLGLISASVPFLCCERES